MKNPLSSPREQRTKVWVDVGGTFTDCIVVTPETRRSTKVLSSGKLRLKGFATSDSHRFRLGAFPFEVALPNGFWIGAKIGVVEADGSASLLGTIAEFDSESSTILLNEVQHKSSREMILEIDAGLEAPVLATRLLLACSLSEPLPELEVRMGTTRGTNALLTRSGANTALLVTRGFGDCLRIGEQDRPELFELVIRKPTPITETIAEVDERLDHMGNVLKSIDEVRLRESLLKWKREGIESIAICFMHAYVNDVHELIAARIAREVGFQNISRSSEVASLVKLVARAETTTLDAYLNPVLANYVAKVWREFGGQESCRLQMMTSAGNLVRADAFRGRDSILSGPAGGVVALGHVAKSSGSAQAIGLDMGGTSTDVSRYTGVAGRRYESRVAGVRVLTPMMDIRTVAAGGGSICSVESGRLVVGPASAGADPGPACYGRGGPLTITDVNLVLGRLPLERFPFPLNLDAANKRLREAADQLPSPAKPRSLESLAEGFLQIAVTHIAEAVRTVSTAEGNDVREMTLVGFGGAAGQHLCRIADSLGMKRIVDHPEASMLSALGMGLAEAGRVVTRGLYRELDPSAMRWLCGVAEELRLEAEELIREEIHENTSLSFRFEMEMRYKGTESSLMAPFSDACVTMSESFHQAHKKAFGYDRRERTIEMVALRCEATESQLIEKMTKTFGQSKTSASFVMDLKREMEADVGSNGPWIDRSSLSIGQQIEAPAMIVSSDSTLVVESPWTATVLEGGVIEMCSACEVDHVADHLQEVSDENDPVMLEVISRRLQGIADAMGEVLRRTAVSVNVKERRDYSCAVFRGDGALVANAPHVPVHLGAMGHTVRRLMKVFPEMSAGDCYLSNDPFSGGSHLPDVTAVTPVFCESGQSKGRPDFFVASRAHHAEIGGRTPGSMPPDARSLVEEGVLIKDFAWVRDGAVRDESLLQLLASGRYPSRNAIENLADLAAQRAAGEEGVRGLLELTAKVSRTRIDAMMGRLLEVAGDAARQWVRTLPESTKSFRDELDDGTVVEVAITRKGDRLTIDFSGTAGVHPFGFNATPAIVTAAVMYVVRTVSGSNLPLCEGVLRDIEMVIPTGLLNPPVNVEPEKCAAVVAGNVETSQRVVDVLLGALGVAAASQGTMNNVLIGDRTFGFYETVCGGSGATMNSAGADAVHTHMTNTRITDPEVMESRLPLRLNEFSIRRGSGGKGKYRGGDGVVREIEFLKPLTLSLITGRRRCGPYGIEGGQPGTPGKNMLVRMGKMIELPFAITIEVASGDRFRMETPGGGGAGSLP